MGMAASQARFLGLTARKSNVEYQGQQINQQRTALANESANLYQQMMDLEVPTPPSSSDYKTTTYTLEDSATNNTGNYRIINLKSNYDGTFKVTLGTDVESIVASASNYNLTSVVPRDESGAEITTTPYDFDKIDTASISLRDSFTGIQLSYDKNETDPFTTDENGKQSLSIKKNKIYKVSAADADKVEGFSECLEKMKKDGINDTEFYFYQDASGRNHFLTVDMLKKILNDKPEQGEVAQIYTAYPKTTESRTEVNAVIEKSSSGRISSIEILGNEEDCPAFLQGKTFSVNTTVEEDEDGYNDAMKDYEYKKGLYEQAVSNINAQTEIIQKDDQQLELRLQQLNTEQDAISTEMDSVSKVIEDNVEKTFKTFA